jgi:nucleotide-binding universal stress UspA family protein
MFTRILVPLDGSQHATRALPVAARIARASHGSIVLMQAVGIPLDTSIYANSPAMVQPPTITQDELDIERESVQVYLDTIQQSEILAGIPVATRVELGTAAQAIEDLANEEQIDLIVMVSRGNTGLKGWILGSVAQKLARHCDIPVLVLHQEGETPDSPFPDRLRPLRSIVAMVALDSSPFAEAAIEPAAQLVSALSAPTQGTLLLTKVVSPLQEQEQEQEQNPLDEARIYLNDVAQRFAEQASQYQVTMQTALASGDDVASTLIQAAEEGIEATGKRLSGACDLIALTTHGRSGLQRLAMGSVTEHILGATKLPLLIVHNRS